MRSPLLSDEIEVHGAVSTLENRFQDTVVTRWFGKKNALTVEAPDTWTEAHRDHRKRGEVDLGIAVAVRIGEYRKVRGNC